MANTELQFNTESLQDQGETYSSLTDLNHIPLFTADFANRVEIKQHNDQRQEELLDSSVFLEQMQNAGTEEQLSSLLFQETGRSVIKKEESVREDSAWLFPLVGIVSLLFLGVLLWYCQRRSRKTERMQQEIEESYVLQ